MASKKDKDMELSLKIAKVVGAAIGLALRWLIIAGVIAFVIVMALKASGAAQ